MYFDMEACTRMNRRLIRTRGTCANPKPKKWGHGDSVNCRIALLQLIPESSLQIQRHARRTGCIALVVQKRTLMTLATCVPGRPDGWEGLRRTPRGWRGRASTRRRRPPRPRTFWGPLRENRCGRRTPGYGGGPAYRAWPAKKNTRTGEKRGDS